ncbi:ExeM/NucH family extracellular endonuclease [Aquihabitans sp. G128]|uniref:ExeM/NucH family extracellular endonuclease n=1 Tax=Aquihabitans sp. G128 TaxID=2849779 RepID=UPI001C21ED78|nr:ExeM/NucH family extracellular endonuclease [Aquihabitans sp. G128]QXC59925.1 ExeM/NucH family extracellular endonuclease [Aquihabitans sp. G128]
MALIAGLLALLPQPAGAATDPFISELHYDDSTAAGDTGEAIEVQADPGTDLTGWKVYLYNGGAGSTQGKTYDNDPLPTPVTTSGVVTLSYATNGIQNGPTDGLALVKPDGTVAEFLSYEGAFTATDGPASGLTATDIGVAETNSTVPGTSLQKIDGAWNASSAASFGTKNTAVVTPPDPDGTCTATGITHTIAQVQGTGDATPVPGPVKVTGVVTADERTGGYNGIYIQTAGTGGASRPVAAGTASDGIFVYFGTNTAAFPTVAIGDRVEVTGTATEFNGLTQITTAAKADTAVCESGVALPAPTPLAFPLSAAARESAEGMLVTPTGTTTVSDVYNTNRYGEITLAGGSSEPAPIITDVAVPGSAEADAQKAANAASRFLLDDGRTTNLSTAGELPPYFSAAEPLRVGDRVATWGPTVLSYGFSEWRLQPTTAVTAATPAANRSTFDHTNPRPAAPGEVGGDVKVGSFNVLNYFVHYGGDARGATNEAGRLKQQAKIVAAIGGLDADVLALEEIENSIKFETDPAKAQLALQTLVAALNADEGAGTWDYVRRPAELPGAASEDVITTAIIYKPTSVTPKGVAHSINDESVWFNAREPIAQTFTAGDATFTVVANHLKSKSPGDNPPTTGDNADVGDGQGNWNGDRRRQAASLTTFVEGLKASAGSDDVLMFGDFNAYTQEDPMRDIYADGYSDVATEFPTGHHSYVFGGEEGSLDHALASASMLDRITGFDIWEINAHESFAFEYDGLASFYDDGPYRASDHNPELVGVRTTDAEPDTVELQLLGINDFHGRLESPSTKPAPDGRPVGGAAQLAGLVDELRAANPDTAFVSAGDNIGASTFISAVDKDNPTLDALDAAGLDVSAIGNHELDKGYVDLRDRVQDRADFPYLGANIYLKSGGRAFDPYFVQTIHGIRVGYVGVITSQTPSLVSPGGITDLEVPRSRGRGRDRGRPAQGRQPCQRRGRRRGGPGPRGGGRVHHHGGRPPRRFRLRAVHRPR